MTDGLEKRKEELFATITLIGAVKRQITELRDTDTAPLYERLSLLESDKERLSHEVNSEYMYRNLQAFMNRVDAYDAARTKEATDLSIEIGGLRDALQAEFHSGLSAVQQTVSTLAEAVDSIQEEVSDLSRRMKSSENDRKNIRERLARLEAVNDRLARIEAAMAAERGNGK